MERLIIAPQKVVLPADAELVFLAGPIQGAPWWQMDAASILLALDNQVIVACPRRPGKKRQDFSQKVYNQQVDWETQYLRRAAKNGVILFWLAREEEHDCGRAYAQTTRFELAEWKVRHEKGEAKI